MAEVGGGTVKGRREFSDPEESSMGNTWKEQRKGSNFFSGVELAVSVRHSTPSHLLKERRG